MKKNKERVVGLDMMRIAMAILIFMFHSRINIVDMNYGVARDVQFIDGIDCFYVSFSHSCS